MISHKDIEKLAIISTLNKMYGCYRDTDSVSEYYPNMIGGFSMNKEFPVKITIGNGEDAYEEVYDVISKILSFKDDRIILDDIYVTLKLSDGKCFYVTTQLIKYDLDIDDYIWENDWWKGETIITVLGLANVSSLRFYGIHDDEDIKE